LYFKNNSKVWEAEIGRIAVPGQPWQKFVRPHLNGKKLTMVARIYYPKDSRNCKTGG
jgi:hypothetical protein